MRTFGTTPGLKTDIDLLGIRANLPTLQLRRMELMMIPVNICHFPEGINPVRVKSQRKS